MILIKNDHGDVLKNKDMSLKHYNNFLPLYSYRKFLKGIRTHSRFKSHPNHGCFKLNIDKDLRMDDFMNLRI